MAHASPRVCYAHRVFPILASRNSHPRFDIQLHSGCQGGEVKEREHTERGEVNVALGEGKLLGDWKDAGVGGAPLCNLPASSKGLLHLLVHSN